MGSRTSGMWPPVHTELVRAASFHEPVWEAGVGVAGTLITSPDISRNLQGIEGKTEAKCSQPFSGQDTQVDHETAFSGLCFPAHL